MHIALFSPAWPANEFPNGIVTYVHNLRTGLISQGHRVSVFAPEIGQASGDSDIHLVEATAMHRITGKLARLAGGRSYDAFGWGKVIAAKINAVHKTDPIDVVEMEESFGWCADVQNRVAAPVVVKLHGPAFLTLTGEDRQTGIARTKIELEGEALRQIATITSPSRRTLLDTVSRYGLEPRLSMVIPNPMAVDATIKPWKPDDCDSKTILFVGRFDRLKGGDTALFAFRRLLEMDPRLQLIFVGPDRGLTSASGTRMFFDEFSKSLFTEAQRRSIRYLGKLPRVEIDGLRRQAMLTIVVSRWENQPNTALEAMLQGCPVVAIDAGGVGEIIEHGVTGLLARGDDIDDLCSKMISLLHDPARAMLLGENARRAVMERHSVPRLTAKTLEVYLRAISMAKVSGG